MYVAAYGDAVAEGRCREGPAFSSFLSSFSNFVTDRVAAGKRRCGRSWAKGVCRLLDGRVCFRRRLCGKCGAGVQDDASQKEKKESQSQNGVKAFHQIFLPRLVAFVRREKDGRNAVIEEGEGGRAHRRVGGGRLVSRHDLSQVEGLVRRQIDSFNHFMHTLLPYIVSEMPEIRTKEGDEEHVVWLCNVGVRRPTVQDADGVERDLLPHLAREASPTRRRSWWTSCTIFTTRPANMRAPPLRETTLCRLPVLLGSDCCRGATNELECRLDQEGTSSFRGAKVLVAGEATTTRPTCSSPRRTRKVRADVRDRSCHEKKLRSTSSLYLYVTATKKGPRPDSWRHFPLFRSTSP